MTLRPNVNIHAITQEMFCSSQRVSHRRLIHTLPLLLPQTYEPSLCFCDFRDRWNLTSTATNHTLSDHRVWAWNHNYASLCWSVLIWSDTSPKTPCFLLLIFQKPLIQLCLFIQMLWAKKWSAAAQSWSITLLCMLHSNHKCVYDEISQSMAVLIGT